MIYDRTYPHIIKCLNRISFTSLIAKILKIMFICLNSLVLFSLCIKNSSTIRTLYAEYENCAKEFSLEILL